MMSAGARQEGRWAASAGKPEGPPRLRSVILVPPAGLSSQVQVVSIGNGPSLVLCTNRSPGISSLTS